MSFLVLPTLIFIIFPSLSGSSCPDGYLQCEDGRCLSYMWICDGHNDCGDFEDEMNCENKTIIRPCMSSQFRCHDGDCISTAWVCDGEHDCFDHSDELNCENDTSCLGFRCSDNHCIPTHWKCDGRNDCLDGSDEVSCPKVCSETEFTCSSGVCIDLDRVCDTKKDCPDASDEGKHCSDICAKANCSQNCRPRPTGPQCHCNAGFSLEKDNKTCTDINECAAEGFCSQYCVNTVGSYKCSCMDGYELINKTCQAKGPEPLLVFSTVKEIKGFYLRSKRYFPIHEAVFKAASIDADPRENRIYWTEISNKSSVYSAQIDGSEFSVVLQHGLLVPEDIAVDYVAKNLYITDSALKQVLVCKRDGSMCHSLHDANVEKPRAICLDLPEGLLYWSDWSDTFSGIYRSGMDGSSRITFVSKNVKWPNGIVVDHTTNRLFWTDAGMESIEYITLDGKTRKILIKEDVFHPYSLTVFEDSLYWSDWNTFSLETCNKFTGHKMSVMTRESGNHIMGVHVYHPVLTKRTNNPCWGHSCSHMCLIAPLNGRRCVCPTGFKLAANKFTCLLDDKFPMLLVNDENKLYQIRPDVVGSSALTELPIKHVGSIGRVAYDWTSKTLFVANLKSPALYAVNMTTFVPRELKINHMVTPEDIAVDSSSGNLYWVDSSKGTVEVVSPPTSRYSIIVVDLPKPVAIALVPLLGKMFVSTIGEDPAVTMYDMDGKNPKVLDAITGLAIALAVHPSAGILYWADPKVGKISSYHYLNERSEPIVLKSNIGNVMSVAVNDKYLYWTDSRHHALNLQAFNSNYSYTIALPGFISGLVPRRVIYESVSRSLKTILGILSCENSNGGCSHMCLTSPRGRSCACPSGMVLDDRDGVSCKVKECTIDEFSCLSDKRCFPREFICDGINDCVDGSDENCDVKPKRCPGNDFRCVSGRCILSSWKCDGRDDCGDNSDEIGCPPPPTNCSKEQFLCGNGQCVPSLWRCDGDTDCNDASDELDCHTTSCDGETQLRCDHGQCIPKSWRCDGASDCQDGTDERNCTSRAKLCGPKQFRCQDGTCIDKSMVCDQRIDCNDGSDEKNCSKLNDTCKGDRFLCKDGICLYDHEVCDGFKDCHTGEDEVNCTRTASQCSQEEYFCKNASRCISKRWICDGDNDCGDAADENPDNCTGRVKPTLPPYEKMEKCDEFFCMYSGECVPWSKVCDGENDCDDLTDEGQQCSKACGEDHGGCSQKCQKTPQGSKCSCYNGYELIEDGVTCEDANECNIPGSCSHFCNNTKGGYKCACAEGFFLEHDHKKCKADGGPATLVYLLSDQIRGIDLNSGSQRVYINSPSADMRGMDYDASEGIFFWSNWKEGTINSFTPNTNKQDVLVTTETRPHLVRWDWIAQNIYYTDDEGSIMCCSKDGKYCARLIPNAAPHITSFDISPNHGLMFWSVWEMDLHKGSGILERAELDGSRRTVVVSDRVVWPRSVTVDHILKMVYWTDVKLNIMECVDFHGLKRRTVVADGINYPFNMAMFEDYVYWSDWGSVALIRCDKFGGGKNCITFHKNIKSDALMVVHKVKQPAGKNRCLNSHCPHLCLPTRTNFVCKCDDGYFPVNKTCEVRPTASSALEPELICPDNHCLQNAQCVVIARNFVCQCPYPFKGDKCEIRTAGTEGVYDYSWVVGVVLAVLFICIIIGITLICRQNRSRLTKVGESVAVTFRNTGWSRKSGRLVVDTDDGDACDELVIGKRGSFKQPGFGNPLFGKTPRVFSDPESQDGDYKRWPSFDSGDSAFVSENREDSQQCLDEIPLSGMKITDRIAQFFRG